MHPLPGINLWELCCLFFKDKAWASTSVPDLCFLVIASAAQVLNPTLFVPAVSFMNAWRCFDLSLFDLVVLAVLPCLNHSKCCAKRICPGEYLGLLDLNCFEVEGISGGVSFSCAKLINGDSLWGIR